MNWRKKTLIANLAPFGFGHVEVEIFTDISENTENEEEIIECTIVE